MALEDVGSRQRKTIPGASRADSRPGCSSSAHSCARRYSNKTRLPGGFGGLLARRRRGPVVGACEGAKRPRKNHWKTLEAVGSHQREPIPGPQPPLGAPAALTLAQGGARRYSNKTRLPRWIWRHFRSSAARFAAVRGCEGARRPRKSLEIVGRHHTSCYIQYEGSKDEGYEGSVIH